MVTARSRRLATGLTAVLVAAAVTAGLALFQWSRPDRLIRPDGCVITALGLSVELDPEQAGNAAVISAVALRRGLPPHAVTVALAAALQESKLRNLDYGDRDSLGLFQQRPSQGWGRPEQILDPRYAASRFYASLVRVRGWQTMPVAEAAQRVQRSADGSAYGQWEPQARSMAHALTGQAAAAVACSLRRPAGDPAKLATAVRTDFGPAVLDRPLTPPARGWAVAGYLVAQAAQFRVTQVSYLGRTWSASARRWVAGGPADGRVRFVTEASPPPR